MSARPSPVRAPAPAPAVQERTVHVVQGEYRVVDRPEIVLSTILGSCVATCLCDPLIGVGGMNHFLLPGDDGSGGDSIKYGVNAMELLINDLLRRGADRYRIEAKLFGGARMMSGFSDIGQKNGVFALEFLKAEGIKCVAESLGGERARRVRYWPATGKAAQLMIDNHDVFTTEASTRAVKPASDSGKLELF